MRQYIEQTATRALTPTGGFLRGFAFSLNPYIGCAFGDSGGCPFCYVRTMPVARSVAGQWGSWVIAKTNMPLLLRGELEGLRRKGKLAESAIFMSSATDPYQGVEHKFRITRGVLEALAANPPRRILLQTRSPLVERDIDLLRKLAGHVIVSITVETDDEAVRRAFTPTSPSIARRLATVRLLRGTGILTQLAISPMLPNNPERFAIIAAEAADRVLIDTYFDGDGSGGRRSRSLGMAGLYERLGYRRWFEPGMEQELIAVMRTRLGPERVLFSREGFNAV